MSESSKVCRKCNKYMPIDKFESSKYRLKNGAISIRYRSTCKNCRVYENRERRAKDPDYWKRNYLSMSESEKKQYIKMKSEYNAKRFKTNPAALEAKKRYDKSDKGIYARYRCDSMRRSRAARGISLDLTFYEFSTIINSPCDYCSTPNCRGIDRLDSSEPYTKDNSVPCCRICNQMKSDLSLEDFLDHLYKVLKHRMEYL